MSTLELQEVDDIKNNLINSPNYKTTRGISVDTSKSPKNLSHLTFNKLVTQMSKSSEVTNLMKNNDRIHSESPVKKPNPGENYILPQQSTTKFVCI
jgi:hypothetical protein